jgi:RNA polymerase sigma factor (sigma-70 family)
MTVDELIIFRPYASRACWNKYRSRPLTKQQRQDDRRLRSAMLEALPQLRRFARSLAANRHDGDDLMQGTVERVLASGVPENVDVLRWMFKVCKNLWIDQLRSHEVKKRAATPLDEVAEPSVSGEAIVLGELTLRDVERAMGALPDEQRVVLSLVAIEGLSYREAADVLETPIGTVMSRLARARAALASQFADSTRADGSTNRTEAAND